MTLGAQWNERTQLAAAMSQAAVSKLPRYPAFASDQMTWSAAQERNGSAMISIDWAQDEAELPLVCCPECGEVASIEWPAVVDEILHLKIRCIQRHWFLMSAERILPYPLL